MTKKQFTEDEILLFSTNLVGQENSTEISNAKSLLLEDGIYSPGHEVATQALEEYGIFEALKEVREYELGTFGEVCTDFSNPEELSKSLFKLIAIDELELMKNNPED